MTVPAGPDDAGVAWLSALEVALTEQEAYRDRAPGWLAGELRARRVPTRQVNRRVAAEDGSGETSQRNQTGVELVKVRARLAELLAEEEAA